MTNGYILEDTMKSFAKEHLAIVLAGLACLFSAGVAVGERTTITGLQTDVNSLCAVQNNGLRAKDDQITIFTQIGDLLAESNSSKATIPTATLNHFTILESALTDYVAFESKNPTPKHRKGC